jgi:glycosyltransferase involved in cell wall biosynthesis
MKNKTFIILSPGFPKDDEDSTCLPSIQNFVRALNEQFPQLNIVILAFDYPFFTGTYNWNNNRVKAFNGWQKGKINKLLKWIKIWRELKKLKKENDLIGLLSIWCGECAYVANRFSKKNKVEHFCWIQGQDGGKDNRYVSRISPDTGMLIALSDFIQSEFERNHGIRPAHIIPVGINPKEFTEEDRVRDIDIIAAGSLIPLKQYDQFVEAIASLKDQIPAIKAMLCGKGPEEARIKELVKEKGLTENIILTGEIPHNALLKNMKRSRLFLHTSRYEGLGAVCIEALYAGCQVISFVRPMQQDIKNWHTVKTKSEMTEKAVGILSNVTHEYKPVLFFSMADAVKKIMLLYHYNEATIS